MMNNLTKHTGRNQERLQFDYCQTNLTSLSRNHLANWGHPKFYMASY